MIRVTEELARETDAPILTALTRSFSIDITVQKSEIDGFGHVNNANYIQWLDQVHWSHLSVMGISDDDILATKCGFVVHKTEVTYHAPLCEGERLSVGTAIVNFDSAFRLKRQFQLVRHRDKVTVLGGTIQYVAIDLTTGKPKRVPHSFATAIEHWCNSGR